MGFPLVRSSAAVGVLLLVLRFYLSRKNKAGRPGHITNFAEVAQPTTGARTSSSSVNPFDEFDVVIVGGGAQPPSSTTHASWD